MPLRSVRLPVKREPKFTAREQEMMDLVAEGKSNKEIAAVMGIKVTSAQQMLHFIFGKSGARNRVELAVQVLERRGQISKQAIDS